MIVTKINWAGVLPAVTTQFDEQLAIDPAATGAMVDMLIREGVHGIVALGTVGENNSLSADEKRTMLGAIVEAAAGRVPVISGVSELTTDAASLFAQDAEQIGADGLMLLPAMVYVPSGEELDFHIRKVAAASTLPVMLYNNPAAYRVSVPLNLLQRWSDVPNIVAVKESMEDSRRFTDIFNACGDRYKIFAGLDDLAFEGLTLGAEGWISGLTNVFPKESLALWEALVAGDLNAARSIYRWFLPLLHLDAQPNLVQCIKLAEEVMGRGSERVRPPRLILSGSERDRVIAMVEEAARTRPSLATARSAA
ncbi:dihydrodipicolinate synthase family protein [Sphingopyxis sp. MWB1]|uniref:dihydrodipicolinate synthase family protein n=1 Tax=Sphingopyxis sp. MWB1 TaxID=1537715 RepID=UPI00190F9DB6|nr:dihydrodipicolinate synthase family protein [Sphingopyxis sp. MWB1]